jgi:hypothetical protein
MKRYFGILKSVKQSVYIETSVVSYLTSRRSRDLLVAAHQQVTIDWWERRAPQFTLYVSELVEAEVADGDSEASIQRRGAVEGIPILPFCDDAAALADSLIRNGAMSEES